MSIPSWNAGDWSREFALIEACECTIEPGLTRAELQAAQDAWGCSFPPDLVEFLQVGLPRSERFPNWREPHSDEMLSSRQTIVARLASDVQNNELWWPEWGERPQSMDDALAVLGRVFDAAPTMIPIYGHRYLPAEPCVAGNPVFSSYGSDTILYGADLRNYIAHEFGGDEPPAELAAYREIEFWSELVRRF